MRIVKKDEADKAKRDLIAKIKRGLKSGKKVRALSDATGYTTARIYQIKKAMIDNGELQA